MARDGSADAARAVDEFEARLAASAFGAATRASYRLESSQQDAQFLAATNLLEKALRRIEAGDEDVAAGLVRRALALEPGLDALAPPGPVAVSTLLVGEMIERLDAAGDGAQDPLVPLLAIHRAADRQVAAEIERALDTVGELDLPAADPRRIHTIARPGIRLEEPLGDIADLDERVAVTLGVLRLVLDLRAGRPAA